MSWISGIWYESVTHIMDSGIWQQTKRLLGFHVTSGHCRPTPASFGSSNTRPCPQHRSPSFAQSPLLPLPFLRPAAGLPSPSPSPPPAPARTRWPPLSLEASSPPPPSPSTSPSFPPARGWPSLALARPAWRRRRPWPPRASPPPSLRRAPSPAAPGRAARPRPSTTASAPTCPCR